MSKNYVSGEIAKISQNVQLWMGNVQNGQPIDIVSVRAAFNASIIRLLFGVRSNKKGVDKTSAPLPNDKDLVAIAELADLFRNNVHDPIMVAHFKSASRENGVSEDLMGLPLIQEAASTIPTIEGKVTGKALVDYLNNPVLYGAALSGTDIIKLAQLGKKARTRKIVITSIIVGTTAVVITAGVITGVCIYKKKKAEKETEFETVDTDDIDDIEDDPITVELEELTASNI